MLLCNFSRVVHISEDPSVHGLEKPAARSPDAGKDNAGHVPFREIRNLSGGC